MAQPAAAHLERLLRRVRAPEGIVIRVVPESTWLLLQIDTQRPDDEAVLAVDWRVEAIDPDKTFDTRKTYARVRLVLTSEAWGPRDRST